jgi:aminoglycoside 6'-N-acetyltransferase I
MREVLASKRQAVFICEQDGCDAGFINVSPRREYVPGATVYPLGYVEGIYVRPAFRRMGLARVLLARGEQWALANGCRHMASDTWVWNTASRGFHTGAGFLEKETLVFYVKRIDGGACVAATGKSKQRTGRQHG